MSSNLPLRTAAATLLHEFDVTMTETLSPAKLYQRIENLETRLAFQEDWLDTLDHAVANQARRLDKLEQVSALMRQRLREQQYALQADNDTAAARPEDDVPPHY